METQKYVRVLTIVPITFQDTGNAIVIFFKSDCDMRVRLTRRSNRDRTKGYFLYKVEKKQIADECYAFKCSGK